MKCLKKGCGATDGFYAVLTRTVQVHAMDGNVLELVLDEEQFREEPFACASCGSKKVQYTNADVEVFWKIFGQRVDRKIHNPNWLDNNP